MLKRFGTFTVIFSLFFSVNESPAAGICNSSNRAGVESMVNWCGVLNSNLASLNCSPGVVYASAYWASTTVFVPYYNDTIYSGGCFYRRCGGGPIDVANDISVATGCGRDFTVSKDSETVKDPVNACGSIIQTTNQNLGETIPVTGTFSLMYFTNRVRGKTSDYTIKVPITGPTVHSNVTGYNLTIKNDLGVRYTQIHIVLRQIKQLLILRMV